MSLKTFDRGAVIVIEVEFQQQPPFAAAAYYDPTTPTITVTDPADTAKVNAAALTKSAIGKWYYLCQTATSWSAGDYDVKINATVGSYTDITISPTAFRLI